MSCAKKWDERYRLRKEPPPVNEAVRQFSHLAPKGRALDIACGMGQNALFLAQMGFVVDAVDISKEALKQITHPRITTFCCDVRAFFFEQERYDLILCINFLERSIFDNMKHALRPGGVLIFETFNEKRRNFNPDYLLQEGELLKHFADLHILHHHERGERTLLVATKESRPTPRKTPHAFQRA